MELRYGTLDIPGYETKTTFWNDFSIADRFGTSAIRDTYKRAMRSWKTNTVYLTELVLVLNHKIWQWYEMNDTYAELYNDLWEATDAYAVDHLKGEDLEYYYRVLD